MKKYLLLLAVAGLMSSCYDLDQYPHDKLSSATFWQTEEHAHQGMMSIYAQMKHEQTYGTYFGVDALGEISFGRYESVIYGSYTNSNGDVSSKWSALYEGVARANLLLQNIDRVDITDALKAQYKGEAKFMRALYYFQLLDFWGGVPLYDETTIISDDFMNMKKPRSSAEEIRQFILDDLEEAIDVLPVKWEQSEYGRATRGAAVALRGKVKLFNQDYSGAATDFEEVVNPLFLQGSANGCGVPKTVPDIGDMRRQPSLHRHQLQLPGGPGHIQSPGVYGAEASPLIPEDGRPHQGLGHAHSPPLRPQQVHILPNPRRVSLGGHLLVHVPAVRQEGLAAGDAALLQGPLPRQAQLPRQQVGLRGEKGQLPGPGLHPLRRSQDPAQGHGPRQPPAHRPVDMPPAPWAVVQGLAPLHPPDDPAHMPRGVEVDVCQPRHCGKQQQAQRRLLHPGPVEVGQPAQPPALEEQAEQKREQGGYPADEVLPVQGLQGPSPPTAPPARPF